MRPETPPASAAQNWQQRLADILELMRDTSLQREPQGMVAAYTERMQKLLPADRRLSLSRRDLKAPHYRITRFSGWEQPSNPWRDREKLPLLSGGILSELLYSDQPWVIDDLEVDEHDPAYEYLCGQRSLMAVPLFDEGVARNMVLVTREAPAAFDRANLPEFLWTSNLFGRATRNLVLAEQVRHAFELLDRELRMVAGIQRALLPAQLPEIPNLRLATYYQTSQRAGGDYYDFFSLGDNQWGILIADVSGHGTPAAVRMAITHSIAHLYPARSSQAGDLLEFLNDQLTNRYPPEVGGFVTAFYGIYDAQSRTINYASAGHNPPRIKHCAGNMITELDLVRGLPLGVLSPQKYDSMTQQLIAADQLVFYTDGITEACAPDGRLFGVEGLDRVLATCRHEVTDIIAAILKAVEAFTEGQPATDDRTIVVGKVL